MATKRQKAIAAKDRARRAQERELEAKQAEQNFKRLQTMTGGFSRTKSSKPVPKLDTSTNSYNTDRVVGTLPAKADPVPERKVAVRLSPEMQKREDEAKEHFKLMQTRIAPAYNKGPDIYVTDGMLEDYTSGKTKRR